MSENTLKTLSADARKTDRAAREKEKAAYSAHRDASELRKKADAAARALHKYINDLPT